MNKQDSLERRAHGELISGYDPYSRAWIVGPRTAHGTIAVVLGVYGSNLDAIAAIALLNAAL